MNFGKTLAKYRKSFGLTQRDLAKQMHVSPGAVALWEVGQRNPDYETLEHLCDIFNVSVDVMLGRKTDTKFKIDNKKRAELIDVCLNEVPDNRIDDVIQMIRLVVK